MKTTRKLFAVVMAVIMVMSLATTAFADTTGTVTNDTARSYKAYQIFSGTQAEGSAVLGDVEWGSGIDGAAFLAELVKIEAYKDCTTAADVAVALKGVADKSDTAKAFANLASKYLTNVATDVAAEATVTLPSGYYLLVDSSEGNNAQNPALLQVTNDTDINITDKSGAPSVDKSIQDDADATDATDANIGDTITFVLTATMPATFEGYDSYKVVFHDTLSKGLTYNGDAEVSVEGFTVVFDENANTITVTNDNVLANGVAAGSTITVTYTATLNKDAEIGAAGNTNSVKLEYSNDPNWNGTPGDDDEPTKETPADEVVVYTFELDVTKVDGENSETKLEGAEFKLSNAEGKWVTVDENGKVTGWADTEEGGSVLVSGADGKFVISGLEAGTYTLKETKAPAGYNLLKDPITLVITATITDTEEEQELTALAIQAGDASEDGDVTTGVVATMVTNNSGATLPETGGMGTTLFYIFGAAMVLGAAVLLITKRRMNISE